MCTFQHVYISTSVDLNMCKFQHVYISTCVHCCLFVLYKGNVHRYAYHNWECPVSVRSRVEESYLTGRLLLILLQDGLWNTFFTVSPWTGCVVLLFLIRKRKGWEKGEQRYLIVMPWGWWKWAILYIWLEPICLTFQANSLRRTYDS